ncbi:Tetratricopeptide-like helical [Penicillium expansum]|nr:Tetratricopeptide-like helical [Penicillium expansum]
MVSTSFYGNNSGLQIGVHTGPINLPPEQPETPTNPLSTVPFPRDEEFVSRDVLLRKVHEKGLVPGSRIALVGLGGVGKSQLAIEYSHQIRAQSPTTWVFWVHGSNESRFEQSFRDIADQVKIPGRRDPQINIFKLVENWFQDQKIGKWICILDNVDDDQLLSMRNSTNASKKPLLGYIPRSQNGYVIITSRSREVALKLVDHKGIIEVNPMESSEALELLQRKLGQPGEIQQSEIQESEQLVDTLEFMPLAIVQAASYIRNRAPRYSVSQYLTDFRKSDREATKLLKKEAGHVYRDWEAKNSILVTWQMSFDYIRQTKPSAADLLSLMSFFDRQGIPENLVRPRPQANYGSRSTLEPLSDSSDGEISESDTGPDFEDDVITLRDYSFISISENSTFTMHRLVQLTTRAWLKSHGEIDQWKNQSISTLFDVFPDTGEYKDWERCRLLFPHVKSSMLQPPTSAESQRRWATLLYRGAWYAWLSSNVSDIGEMASLSRDQRIVLLGDEHEDVIDSTLMLALSFWLEGRWEAAEQLQLQATQICKTKLGEDHHTTLRSIANLAVTFSDQGRWKEAEDLQAQVMKTCKIKLGEDHPDTVTSMANLAATFANQGRWKEAEDLQVQVIKTRKIKLGEDHPDTVTSIASLAATFSYQGRWKEAEDLKVQVIKTRKIKLGGDHSDTVKSMANLAVTFRSQGRWKEAEGLQAQVMKTSKIKLGEDHPDTLTSMANLAVTFLDQGRWKEAEDLQAQVIKTCKIKLGEDHPDTLTSMANLAVTFSYQGWWKEAEDLKVQVMKTRKIKLGEDHPDTLTSMTNLAVTFLDQGRWKEAEDFQAQVMKTCKIKLGEDHPDTLTSMANLAATFWSQDRWKEAEDLEMQVLKIRKAKLGEGHPRTLISMSNLAHTWKSSGRDAEAIDLLRSCLAKRKQIIGPDHPDTLATSERLLEWETSQPKGLE